MLRRLLAQMTQYFAHRRKVQLYEKQEKVKDIWYDEYYKHKALNHLNQVLISFGRQPQGSLHNALWYVESLGIHHPYSDSIMYMKNMKTISKIQLT